MSRSNLPPVLSLLYTHNPFYLLSAGLFVYGLKLLFRAGNSAVLFSQGSVAYMEPWGLLGSFMGVTLLMSVTAILIVRLGKVWEDARSLILIALLMLLAIAVSMDELISLLSDKDNSRQHLLLMFACGTGFALSISEVLLRGLQIRLSWLYRGPLYLLLSLFFLWPALLLPEVTNFSAEQTRWLVAAFPTAAGIICLLLIPAIRRSSASVQHNGTPWQWPWFPWTPFVFLGAAVCFRAYSLTMSYDAIPYRGHFWDTSFGLYMLAPFLLAIITVLLEIGIVERLPRLINGSLLAAPLLLLIAYPWWVPWSRLPLYTTFTLQVVQHAASPVFLVLMGLLAFYLWAALRGVRRAELGVTAILTAATFIGPRAFGNEIWQLNSVNLQLWPLLAVGVFELAMAIRRRRGLDLLLAACAFAGILLIGIQRTSLTPGWQRFVISHLPFVVVLMVGMLSWDSVTEFLRRLGAPMVSATTLACCLQLSNRLHHGWLVIPYLLLSTVVAIGLWRFWQAKSYLIIAILQGSLMTVGGLIGGVIVFLRMRTAEGIKPVILGASCFLIAVIITLLKAGLARRIRCCLLSRRLQPEND
ncbi:MAG: hypothetical protein KDA85_20015 [Planctomycetaceae bacterium]|nr:hypothetical protein [Planctomycetaceae bacterium]